jgi:pimeloyl-ACP methyl ester carboxylesterase
MSAEITHTDVPNTVTEKVISKDGTSIVYDKVGTGPALILVTGALGTRMSFVELAQLLAPHFTVYYYDRRGRGDSSDTQPYAVAREIEDIEAIIDAAGGSALLYGISSGAALALEAANALPHKVSKAVLYEPPFIVDDSHAPLPDDYVPHLKKLIAEGRRGDAVAYFMSAAVGVPAEFIAQMRQSPMWPSLEAVAHTIYYDGMIMGTHMSGKPLPRDRWTSATMPILVLIGGNSDAFFSKSGNELASILPNAQYSTLPDQDHNVAPAALAPRLIEFYTS